LREIAETRGLLECLITSSETFDYQQAKIALEKLNRKIRELTRMQSKLSVELRSQKPEVHLVDFSSPN
jgi:hypothetical protein